MRVAINPLDIVILVGYLGTLVAVGLYFSTRQKSLDEFFRAGQSMTWLPIGLSLMAALNSGIDYLMQPAATIRFGLILLVGTTSWLVLYPWVSRVTLPFYRRLNVFTAYEYLEARFDVRVRTLAAGIFIVWRLGWMATAIYVPSLAISAATGGAVPLIPLVVGLGALVTLYTALGGIRAVIWNDVIQFSVMFGGLAATVGIALAQIPGGLGEIWTVARDAGKTALHVAPPVASGVADSIRAFFAQPVNVPAILSGLIVGRMAGYTADQVMVQRFQTTKSLPDSRRAFVVNAASDVLWMAGLSFVGLALFAYFQHRSLPPEYASDKILPFFMAQVFPPGAVGLVTAAILAASLSSIDSALNSCTSVAVVDLIDRLWRRPRDRRGVEAQALDEQRADLRLSRVTTVAFGALGTVLACNVSRIGTLIEILGKLVNAFTGPLLGIYLLAMFSPRTRGGAALAGGLAGFAASYYVAYSTGIGFMWPSTFGLTTTLVVGLGLTLAAGAAADARDPLTWSAVMRGDRLDAAPRRTDPAARPRVV